MSSDPSLVDLVNKASSVQLDADVPPRRGPGRPTAGPPKKQTPLPPWKTGVISAWAEHLYVTVGKMVAAFEPNYGTVLQGIAAPAGQAWENLAKDSPQLRRIFHHLMTTTKLSELLMAHVPLFILILHKHGPVKSAMEGFADKFAAEMAAEMEHASMSDGHPVGDDL